MLTIECEGKKYEVDGSGYLKDSSVWHEGIVKCMAREDDDFVLTEAHWWLIRFIREYYEEHNEGPINDVMMAEMNKSFNREVKTNKYLFELFPAGPGLQIYRYAGLPAPT